jgi:hypothetical protein
MANRLCGSSVTPAESPKTMRRLAPLSWIPSPRRSNTPAWLTAVSPVTNAGVAAWTAVSSKARAAPAPVATVATVGPIWAPSRGGRVFHYIEWL